MIHSEYTEGRDFMRRLFSPAAAVILLLLILMIGVNPVSAGPAADPVGLEAFLDGFITGQMKEHNIIGATLALVQDGEIILLKGYGYSDRESRAPVDPVKTIFRPGSTTKLITWTAVMQLVEQGILDLDTDINDYLDFEIPAYLHGSGSRAAAEPITLRHLMTHTPGFEDSGQGLFVLSAEDMVSLEEYLKNSIPARVYPPGQVMAYSNYGTALAGYIVELASGLAFDEYAEKNIFDPLGMRNSTFRQPLPDRLAPAMAGAFKFFEGEYYRGSFEYISALPAGSMSSTAEDMARFMIVHLQYGRFDNTRILKEATAREMQRQQFTHHPRQDGMTLGFIEQTINGRRTIGHGGNTFLFATGCWLLPEENVGLFVSYSGGTGLERELLIKVFMDRYYPGPAETDLTPPPGSIERSMAFTGPYQPNRANFSSVEKLFRILSTTRVNLNSEGFLTVNLLGYPQQFAEVEPGVYQNRYSSEPDMVNTLVFVPNHEGALMMCAEGPVFTMTKTPWYGTANMVGFLVGNNLILFLTAAVGWCYAGLGRRFRKEKSEAPRAALAGRLAAILYFVLLLIFITVFMGVVGDIDPAFGVPRVFLEDSGSLDSLLILPYLVAAAAAAVMIFSIMAWIKRYWNRSARLHYTVLALSCLGLIWVMRYTNLL